MPRKKPDYSKPLPGFPVTALFATREEVDAYLTGDRITCLLCGYSFKGLAPHVEGAHDMSADEYRERYGLPYQRGLVCAETSAARSAHSKQFYMDNKEQQDMYLARAKAVQAEHGNPQRTKPQFWKNERTQYTRADFEEFARRVLSGRAALQVEKDPDMPHVTHVKWYMKRNPDFAAQWEVAVSPIAKKGWRPEGVTISTQTVEAIRALKGSETMRATAERFGVSESAVWHIQNGTRRAPVPPEASRLLPTPPDAYAP